MSLPYHHLPTYITLNKSQGWVVPCGVWHVMVVSKMPWNSSLELEVPNVQILPTETGTITIVCSEGPRGVSKIQQTHICFHRFCVFCVFVFF